MYRLKELDVLRGFAALNVVLFHYTARFHQVYEHNTGKYDWVYGRYGVELFFVISGFVIFMTLQKVRNVNEFAYKRFLRLFPTYWICLIITLIITYILHGKEYTLYEVLMNFTMIQGVFEVNNIDGAYWSLLPELLFYVFMAFVFFTGRLTRVKTIAVGWLSLMILNKLNLLPFGEFLLNLKYGMFFLAGILFYEIKFNKGTLTTHLLVASCLITAWWVHQTPGSMYVFTGIFALFYLFIYDRLKGIRFPPLLFLGYISYPLYLLHQNIGFYLMRLLKFYIPNEFIIILIAVSVLIFIAWVVTRYLEKPILRYIKSKSYRNALLFKKENNKETTKQEVMVFNSEI